MGMRLRRRLLLLRGEPQTTQIASAYMTGMHAKGTNHGSTLRERERARNPSESVAGLLVGLLVGPAILFILAFFPLCE